MRPGPVSGPQWSVDGRDHTTPTAGLDALLILGAAAAQALFFVLQRPLLDRYTGFEVTTYATWIGALAALPAAGHLAGDPTSDADPSALASVVFLGVGPSAIGFLTWAYAQRRTSVAAATNTLYLAPPSPPSSAGSRWPRRPARRLSSVDSS